MADIDFTHPHTFQDGPGPDHTFFSAAVALPGPELDTSFRMYFVTIFSWSFLGLERFQVFPNLFWAGCPKSETPLVSCLPPLESSVTQQEQIESCRDEWESETPHPEMGNMSTLLCLY